MKVILSLIITTFLINAVLVISCQRNQEVDKPLKRTIDHKLNIEKKESCINLGNNLRLEIVVINDMTYSITSSYNGRPVITNVTLDSLKCEKLKKQLIK